MGRPPKHLKIKFLELSFMEKFHHDLEKISKSIKDQMLLLCNSVDERSYHVIICVWPIGIYEKINKKWARNHSNIAPAILL